MNSSFSNDLESEANPDADLEVLGLEFSVSLGELAVARVHRQQAHVIWLSIHSPAAGRCVAARVVDFLSEIGESCLPSTLHCPYSLNVPETNISNPVVAAVGTIIACTDRTWADDLPPRLPMAYSSLPEGRGVNCLLLGGPQGRLVWLNSWTLDTIQVIQLDQPEPCHISCLVFGPLDEGPYGPAQIFSDLGLRPSLSSSPGPDVSCEFRRKSTKSSEQTANDIPSAEQLLTPAEQLCQALYVVDAAGWLYQLSPDRRFKATRIPLSRVPHCSIRS